MGSILDDLTAPAKILLIGKTGTGKTGSLASLVCAGYRIRMIDTDKGIRTLRSLLTDKRYPYAKIIEQRGIDLATAVRFINIDIPMKLRTISTKTFNGNTREETLLAPSDAKAWPRVLTILDRWREGDLDLGSIETWTTDDVLVIDSFSTLSKCAFYFAQSLNTRLGARETGNDYRRDIGEAQSQLTRLLELLHNSKAVPCNVVLISHITWVDDSAGVAQRPNVENQNAEVAMAQSDGYPSSIGRALSPQMGKYFNDSYTVSASGTGESVRRVITTVPRDGVVAKNSVFLDREYSVSAGLAQIFAQLLSRPLPSGFVESLLPQARRAAAPPSASSSAQRSSAAGAAV